MSRTAAAIVPSAALPQSTLPSADALKHDPAQFGAPSGDLMSRRAACLIIIASALLTACNECENGYKVKTEYKYVSSSDFWLASPADTYLDGAIRTTTSTYKDARSLTLRCFQPASDKQHTTFDLRYTISAPLLKRVVPELQKAGSVEIVVTVDGISIGTFKARAFSHDHGVSFLADINRDIVEKIAAASKKIVAMPRQKDEKLDELIEFGVAELSKHINPVKKACENARSLDMAPTPEPLPQPTKKT